MQGHMIWKSSAGVMEHCGMSYSSFYDQFSLPPSGIVKIEARMRSLCRKWKTPGYIPDREDPLDLLEDLQDATFAYKVYL